MLLKKKKQNKGEVINGIVTSKKENKKRLWYW